MLTCTDISAGYSGSRGGGVAVLHGVSLGCQSGQITTILGPNGSGKTTLLRVMLGLLPVTNGVVACNGRDIAALSMSERASRLAYAPQLPTAAAGFSTGEVLSLATAGLMGVGDRDPGSHMQHVIDGLDLGPLLDVPHEHLSAGQRQRVSLGRAVLQLLASPLPAAEKFLLADEPGSAMDPAHLLMAEKLLRGLAREGMGIVIVLHDLLAASRLADAAVVLSRSGSVTHVGPPGEVLTPTVLAEVFGTQFVATPHGPVLLSQGD